MRFLRGLGLSATAFATTLATQVAFGATEASQNKLDDVGVPVLVGVAGVGLNCLESEYAIAAGSAAIASSTVQTIDIASVGRMATRGARIGRGAARLDRSIPRPSFLGG